MKSTLIDQLKALKTANPKMTATEFAEKANVLLDANGIGFAISFDSTACERLKKVKEQLKDPNAPLKLGATLKSVDAEGASLALPEPLFASTECGGCYIELPLLQVTEKDFITMIAGRNIKFHLPSNFHVNEAFLLDAKDQTTMKKKWRIPFRSTPIGVSYDENVLYLGFFEQELFELSLMVFGEGVFQITTRADAENGGNGKLVEPPILIRSNPLTQAIRFDRWRNAYLIGFQRACQR
ncbi:MAG: hypothetical protein ACT4O9_05575 [Blastocatellia bacterium]